MYSEQDSIISLFSGAGGCSIGFATAGLRPMFAADLDKDACATYSSNLGIECERLDLATEESVRRVLARTNGSSPFIIVGGPPCQGFSTAGPRNAADPRNQLIFNYLELIARTQPRWFMFENVEGLLTSNGGSDIVRLARELTALGYTFRIEKVNFASYGLPQTRKRVLIVGNRLGQSFKLPSPRFSYDSGKAKSYSSLPHAPSLFDAICDLPNPNTNSQPVSYDLGIQPTPYASSLRSASGTVSHHFTASRSEAAAIAKYLQPGQTMKDLPLEMQHESFRRRANRRVSDGMPTEKRGGAPAGFKRLRGDLNALTITSASPREFIHPTNDRPLTLRECARLQSFPDAFYFFGNTLSVARQIGNAIPPLASRILAEAILGEEGKAGGANKRPQGSNQGLIGFHLTDSDGMSPALANTANALNALMSNNNELPLFRKAHG